VTVTLTYDSTLSRVRISANSLGPAVTALFERSTDQVVWTTVRGGAAASVTSGAASLDDYEFAPNVVNYYRVTTPKAITFVAAGTAAHADNTALDPALPAGWAQNDLLLVLTAIRNTGGGADTPSGYTALVSMGHVKLCGKIAGSSESAPHCTYSGVAGDSTSAQTAAFRNAQLVTSLFATLTNAAAQNINYPALTVTEQAQLVLFLGWKRDDWTSIATIGGPTEIGDPSTTLGNDQGIVWDYGVYVSPPDIPASAFDVTGGTSEVSKGAVVAIRPAMLQQTNSITPNLTQTWLKSVARPFLNSPVVPLKPVVISSGARSGVFEVVGRSLPVALTDVRAHRAFTLRMYTETDADRDRLQLVLDSGDPVFLHTPPGSPVDSAYGVLGDEEYDDTLGVFAVAFRRVAAPGPDVVGSTSTWQTVVNTYATWADVIAANSTWADLLNLIGDPSEVIVP
jgi:hypothetical protein